MNSGAAHARVEVAGMDGHPVLEDLVAEDHLEGHDPDVVGCPEVRLEVRGAVADDPYAGHARGQGIPSPPAGAITSASAPRRLRSSPSDPRVSCGTACSRRWNATVASSEGAKRSQLAQTPPPKTTTSGSRSAIALTVPSPSHRPTSSHAAGSSRFSPRTPKRRSIARPLASVSRQQEPPQCQGGPPV